MKVLIVVDMQNDFLHGSLRNEQGIKIIPGVVEKIKEYKKDACEIIATRDTHYSNYLSTQEGKKLPVVHCVKDSQGWQINADVQNALGDVLIFDKPTFGSIELASYLTKRFYDNQSEITFELVGVCTDICVISNATLIKAALPEARVCVNKNLCAGVSEKSHETALLAMQSIQIEII